MSPATISFCEYPTQVVLVDDNKNFTDTFIMQLPESLVCKTFHDPREALQYLNHDYQHEPLAPKFFSTLKDESAGHTVTNFSIQSLHEDIYNPLRFNQISVVITDYSMSDINGLSFCEQIIHPDIKKILITGESGYDLSIEAFNKRLIHKFFLKGAQDLTEMIADSLEKLQNKYHASTFDAFTFPELSILEDPEFKSIFRAVYKEMGIIEYYLLDKNGSYLMLDMDANLTWLVISNKDHAKHTLELLKRHGVNSSKLDSIANLSHILFLPPQIDLETQAPPHNWEDYLHEAKCFGESDQYNYAVITDSGLYPLGQDITSYRSFLDEYDAAESN